MPGAQAFPCRSCRAAVETVVLDLGEQPASDLFPEPAGTGEQPAEPRWPLRACVCERCWLVQLVPVDGVVEQVPLAVESSTSRRLAERSVAWLLRATGLPRGSRVRESVSTHGGSWREPLVASGQVMVEGEGLADLVLDVHALSHEEDVEAALSGHVAGLAPDGWLVLEFHHLLPLVVEGQFDVIRHAHPVYVSVLTLRTALERHGLVLVDATSTPAFGGSLVLVASWADLGRRTRATVEEVVAAELAAGLNDAAVLRGLQRHADEAARELRRYLEAARGQGRRVVGYGASSKAPIRLGYAGVGPELVPLVADLAIGKHGRLLPGCRIPICSPEELMATQPDEVLIMVWDLVDEVVRQLREIGAPGIAFSVPVPTPHRVA